MTSPAEQPIDNQTLLAAMPGRCQALLAREPALRAHCLDAAHYEAVKACRSSIASAQLAARLYRDRLCFGERRADGPAGFEPITYGAFWERVRAFATGLTILGLARAGQFVGLCAAPSIDWVVADFACLYLGLVSVPLPTTLTHDELGHIVAHVDLACIVCSPETQAPLAAALSATGKGGTPLVLAGRHAPGRAQALPGVPHGAWTMDEVEEAASGLPARAPVDTRDDEVVRTLLYTSGSSGSPKGAMFPERVWKLHWQGGFFSRQPTDLPYITLAYMPLSHAMGRAQVINSFIRGGLTCFTSRSDMSTLLEDIGLVRPTLIAIVPRVAAMIRDCAAMASAPAHIMGDRLLVISTGSALMPPDLLRFLQTRFHVPVLDGYGSTEAGLLTFEGRINHESVAAFKLLDRPDLGYLTTDLPHPRGELLVKTQYMVSGYFQDEAGTEALFDEEGFLRTGDIVARQGEDGITVIDRARNVVKLSHGEFVNLARLEDLYATGGSLIRQVFLLGGADRPYLMAVVVPDLSACREALGGAADVWHEDQPELRDLLHTELHRLARKERLKGFEVPQVVAISFAAFTRENGLLTETLKPARGKLRTRFEPALLALSEAASAAHDDGPAQAADPADGNALRRFEPLLRHALGIAHLPPSWPDSAFVHLGGDSMAAMRLSALCAARLDLALPPGRILDPSLCLRDLVAMQGGPDGDAARGRAQRLFARVHGDGRILRAADLDLGVFLAEDGGVAPCPAGIPRTPEPGRPAQVLLTGANGFFGRAILARLLQGPSTQGRVHCLVRGANEAQARMRLMSAMSTDDALARLLDAALADGRVRVLAGDVARPGLGLPADVYQRLRAEVDQVVHNGALVNHAFAYEALFEPNVVGTTEVIAFALAGRPKPLCFVSSAGVASPEGHDTGRGGDGDREGMDGLVPEWPTHGYAWGYAGSKWASEVLLRQASARHGLPVTVMRPGWLLAHRRYAGQINEADLLCRLLFGLVRTGVLPPDDGEQAPITFSAGVPVDEAASAVAACLGQMASGPPAFHGHRVHHLPGWAGAPVTMGDLSRWLREAGYAGRAAADHESWHAAFVAALRELPDQESRHSPLLLLEDWKVARLLLWETSPAQGITASHGGKARHAGLDRDLIRKSLSDLSSLGLIPPPGPLA